MGLSADSRCPGQSGPPRGPHHHRKHPETHGIEPAPERSRRTTWKEFLSRPWDQIIATDFFTVEVWTCRGLTRFVVLFFMDLSTRKVEIGGIAGSANGLLMSQIARNSDGCHRWFFCGQALSHSRSRSAIYEGVSGHNRRVWHRIRQASAAITESKCLCGTIRPYHQRKLFGPDDLVW